MSVYSSEPNGSPANLTVDPMNDAVRPGLPAAISAEVLRLLPSEFVKRNRVLPLEVHQGSLRVATAELGNQTVIEDIRLLTGLEVEETLAPAGEILERIAETYQVTVEQMLETLKELGSAAESRNLHDIE